MSTHYGQPRDRSPPRNFERPPPGPGAAHPSRSANFNSRTDTPVDVPRGPRAAEPGRSLSYSGPPAARGRNFSGRGDLRNEHREREPARFGRDPSPQTDDRERSWRPREDRRSPPRARPPQVDSRASSPRNFEAPRVRAPSRERPPSTASTYSSRGYAYAGRGGGDSYRGDTYPARRDSPPPREDSYSTRGDPYSRGRGRGWAPRERGRGRGGFYDDRPSYRPRSRSPVRGDRWPRDSLSDDRLSYRTFDDRRIDRREDDRDDRPRDRDPAMSRRPSIASPSLAPLHSAGLRHDVAYERDQAPPRRFSGSAAPPPPKDSAPDASRSSYSTPKLEPPKERYAARGSSPPRAPEVPAFGSAIPQPWNVWRASDASKPAPKPPATVPPASTSNPTASAPPVPASPSEPKAPTKPPPTEPKIPPKAPKAELERATPTAPKADRLPAQPFQTETRDKHSIKRDARGSFDEPRTTKPSDLHLVDPRSPPTGPRQLTNPPSGPRASRADRLPGTTTSQARERSSNANGPITRPTSNASMSPVLSASGWPRGPSTAARSPSFGTSVPTGPRAERVQGQTPRYPSGPPLNTNRNVWQRPNSSHEPAAVLPVKRDFNGREKTSPVQERRPSASENIRPAQRLKLDNETEGKEDSKQYAANSNNNAMQQPQQEKPEAIVRKAFDSPSDDDGMDLDEDDYEKNEAKFASNKARLESKMTDLDTRRLRASTPLEQLAILNRLALEDLSSYFEQRPPVKTRESEITGMQEIREMKNERKSERKYEEAVTERASTPRTSPSPIGTPDLKALPFLSQTPMTELSELDELHDGSAKNDLNKQSLGDELRRQLNIRSVEEEEIREEYARLYKPWRQHVNSLDRLLRDEEERENQQLVDPTAAVPVDAPSPTIPSSAIENRRARGTFSDYDLQKVMQESLETEREAQAKRDREASYARPDYDREAAIPELLSEADKSARKFTDTSEVRQDTQALLFYRLDPPRDHFTREEHEIIIANWRDYPKKWGSLAALVPGRTYKDCINHYYTTKWGGRYKSARDKRTRKVVSNKPRRGAGKSRANALISNLDVVATDSYDGEGSANAAITESGRPRRAAAPTFSKDSEDQPAASATPARRGAKNEILEPGSEKVSRRGRGGTGPRGTRRGAKTQASVRSRSSVSPEKRTVSGSHNLDARESSEMSATPYDPSTRELEAARDLAQLQLGQPSHLERASSQAHYSPDGYGQATLRQTDMNRHSSGQVQKSGPSSYWSVNETTIFPHLLEHYGSDWQSIANHMGTKSHTMVRNYYQRLTNAQGNSRKDLEDLTRKADERRHRGEPTGPVPSSTQPQHQRKEVQHPSAPRPIAPSTETSGMEDETPPAATGTSIAYDQSGAYSNSRMQSHGRSTSFGQYNSPREANAAAIASVQYSNNPHIEDLHAYPHDSRVSAKPSIDTTQSSRYSTAQVSPSTPQIAVNSPHRRYEPSVLRSDPLWQSTSREDPFTGSVTSRSQLPGSVDYQPREYQARDMDSHLRQVSQMASTAPHMHAERENVDSRQHASYPTSYGDHAQITSGARYVTEPQTSRPYTPSPMYEHARQSSQLLSRQHSYDTTRPSSTVPPTSAAPRTEPRKTSNLMSILNAEPDEPAPPPRSFTTPAPAPINPRTSSYATTAGGYPPPRPSSQPIPAEALRQPPPLPPSSSSTYQHSSLNPRSSRETHSKPMMTHMAWQPESAAYGQPHPASHYERGGETQGPGVYHHHAGFQAHHFGTQPSPPPPGSSPAAYASHHSSVRHQHDVQAGVIPNTYGPPSRAMYPQSSNEAAHLHNAKLVREEREGDEPARYTVDPVASRRAAEVMERNERRREAERNERRLETERLALQEHRYRLAHPHEER